MRRRALLSLPALHAAAGGAWAEPGRALEGSYSTSAFRDLMDAAAARYEQVSTARIRWRSPVPPTHDDHLQQTLRWALTGDLPDLSFQANNHVPRLARAGLAQPLAALAEHDPGWAPSSNAAVARIGIVDGRLHGIPFQVSVPVVMVNLDLAARAGVDLAGLPQDWPGLLDLGRRISALSGRQVGCVFDFGGAWTFQALVTAAGGRMASPDDRRVAFDGPEGLAALEVIRGFGEAGMVDMTQAQALQAFGAGSVGVLATSNNVLTGLQRQAGGRFRIGTVPWPMTSLSGRLPAGGRTAVVFTREPTRQAEAWQFLRFMASPEIQALVVQATGAIPVDAAAADRQDLLGIFYATNTAHRAGLVRADVLQGWYSFPGDNTLRIVEMTIDYLRQVASLKVTPSAALHALARSVQNLLPPVG